MKFYLAKIWGFTAAALLTTGCLNSEGEFNRLNEQNALLAAELQEARRENEILNQALANITEERQRLLAALAPYEPAPAAGAAEVATGGAGQPISLAGDTDAITPPGTTADSPAGAGPTPSGRMYVAQRGDTLSNIADRHQTTVQELLALNPYLQRRTGYMVWENDNIELP